MTVLLVLATFLVFIALDYVLNRRKAVKLVPATEEAHAAGPVAVASGGNYVDGFLVPQNLSYHPGHTWVVRERKGYLRVGTDEFAAALLGGIDRIELPKVGQWVRQGQKVATFGKGELKAAMVCPTEGEVLEVNPEILNNPAVLRQDPYGKGWLMAVHVPDEENTGRNLVPKGLVREWMRDAVERLYAEQPALAGAAAADGGRPAEDLLAALPASNWAEVTGEFFLTM